MFFSKKADVEERVVATSSSSVNDEADLAALGYKSEFKREFTNLGTISFAFSIMYVFYYLPLAFIPLPSFSDRLRKAVFRDAV